MPCEFCHGRHGWFVDRYGVRVPPEHAAAWVVCCSCIGGIASCCEGAVGGPSEAVGAGEGTKRIEDGLSAMRRVTSRRRRSDVV